MPFNLESKEIEEPKLSQRDKLVKQHLEEMSEITRNLGYNDINLLKRNSNEIKKEAEKVQKEETKEQENEKEVQ